LEGAAAIANQSFCTFSAILFRFEKHRTIASNGHSKLCRCCRRYQSAISPTDHWFWYVPNNQDDLNVSPVLFLFILNSFNDDLTDNSPTHHQPTNPKFQGR
jgi:hypothetical protein